jgi:serine protease Do
MAGIPSKIFRIACLPAILFLILIPARSLQGRDISLRKSPVVRAVEKVSPAVVNINTEKIIQQRVNPFSGFNDPFFDEVFKNFFNSFPQRNYKKKSLGSGVIFDKKGYILTNAHVVSRATKINVTLGNKKEYEATVVGADPKSDLAIIKVEARENLPVAEMGRSDDLLIGETIIAIGNPFGLSHTVTSGVISATGRSINGAGGVIYHDFIQIDASINPGNSGGPLVNIYGEVIGINTAIYRNGEGIGFAIPINKAKRIINDLIVYGRVKEAWLGIIVQDITPRLAEYFHFKGSGVLISGIYEQSPAHEKGLERGDIITSIEDIDMKNKETYRDHIVTLTPNDRVRLVFIRNGKKQSITITAKVIPESLAMEIAKKQFGFSVKDITQEDIRTYRLFARKGVMVNEVMANSQAGRIGLAPGDVVLQINQKKINNTDDFRKGIVSSRNRKNVTLLVQRERNGYYITMEP